MGERSENAAPRKKRRLPWMILALLLVLASGVAWWFWPRVDPRFVGTWAVTSRPHNFPFGGEEMLVLLSNGFGIANPGQEHPARFRWMHDGNKILLETYQDDGPGSYLRAKLAGCSVLRRWFKNTPPANVDVEFTVFGVTEQTLRMKDTTPGMFPPEPWGSPHPLDHAALEFRRVE